MKLFKYGIKHFFFFFLLLLNGEKLQSSPTLSHQKVFRKNYRRMNEWKSFCWNEECGHLTCHGDDRKFQTFFNLAYLEEKKSLELSLELEFSVFTSKSCVERSKFWDVPFVKGWRRNSIKKFLKVQFYWSYLNWCLKSCLKKQNNICLRSLNK